MITFFNRKLLLSTMNMDQYANAREDLVAAGIDFRVKTKGQVGKHTIARTHTLPNGKNITSSGMVYDLYVHEKDYNKAMAAIHKKGGF